MPAYSSVVVLSSVQPRPFVCDFYLFPKKNKRFFGNKYVTRIALILVKIDTSVDFFYVLRREYKTATKMTNVYGRKWGETLKNN